MGGTHFVELGFQLTHIPLHFLYGGSVETEKDQLNTINFTDVQRHKLDDEKTHCRGTLM